MAVASGIIQNPTNISFSDGDEAKLILGKQAEQLVSALHSEYYTQTYRGYVYHASTTPLGLAIPIYTSVTPIVALWNPIGSGRNLSLLNVVFAHVSGTAAHSAIGLMYYANAGSTIATGAVFSAFGTNNCLVNGLVGGGNSSIARVATAGTTTLSAAGSAANWFYTLGNINLEADASTAHATFVPGAGSNPKGSILIPPGTAVWLASTVASVALYATTISWAESPT
jgi:hypothetical protein